MSTSPAASAVPASPVARGRAASRATVLAGQLGGERALAAARDAAFARGLQAHAERAGIDQRARKRADDQNIAPPREIARHRPAAPDDLSQHAVANARREASVERDRTISEVHEPPAGLLRPLLGRGGLVRGRSLG